jgi:Ni,Fe-hydrogenase maturation factor
MNAVAMQNILPSALFQEKAAVKTKRISWTIGVHDANGSHFEEVMSNQDVHSMNPAQLVALLKNDYNDMMNVFACESDNVNTRHLN